jgi:hypothetical protein
MSAKFRILNFQPTLKRAAGRENLLRHNLKAKIFLTFHVDEFTVGYFLN